MTSRFAPEISTSSVAAAQVRSPSTTAPTQPMCTYGIASRRPAFTRKATIAATTSRASSPSRRRMMSALAKIAPGDSVPAGERLLRLREQRFDARRLLLHLRHGCRGADEVPQRHHRPLGLADEARVDVAQRRFHELEAVEVRLHGELARPRAVAGPVRGGARGDLLACQRDRRRLARGENPGLRAEIRLHERGVVAELRLHLVRRELRHVGDVRERRLAGRRLPQCRALCALGISGSEVGGVEGERPSVVLRKLPERGHRRARDAEADRAV